MNSLAVNLLKIIPLPKVLCDLIISYVTVPILDQLFQDFDLAESSAIVSRYFWEKNKNRGEIENELKKLLNKECVEDKQLTIAVDKATSMCNTLDKESLMKLLQRLLEEQFQKTCWQRDWRLESFTFIRDIISDLMVPFQRREAAFNLCRVVGGVIYQDINIGALEIPLFQLVLHKILLEKLDDNALCDAISKLIDEKIISKLHEEGWT